MLWASGSRAIFPTRPAKTLSGRASQLITTGISALTFLRLDSWILTSAIIEAVGEEFGQKFGRTYSFFEEYRTEDADICIVVMSSAAGTCKDAVDMMREEGIKVGLLKPRIFRPFPHERIAAALKDFSAVAVLDRSVSPGAFGGPLFSEIRSALYDFDQRPKVVNYIYGLGGRDISVEHFREVGDKLDKIAETGKVEEIYGYLNLRE